MFLQKVSKNHWFLNVIFQKACVFSSGEPRGTRCTKKSGPKQCVFKTFRQKVVVSLDVFAKSITKTLVFEGHFSKCRCFFIGGTPRNQRGTSRARNEYLTIWKSEPYYARRIFREKGCRNLPNPSQDRSMECSGNAI